MVVQDLCVWQRGEYNLERKILPVYSTSGGGVLITHPINEKEPHYMKFSPLDDADYKVSDSTEREQGGTEVINYTGRPAENIRKQ